MRTLLRSIQARLVITDEDYVDRCRRGLAVMDRWRRPFQIVAILLVAGSIGVAILGFQALAGAAAVLGAGAGVGPASSWAWEWDSSWELLSTRLATSSRPRFSLAEVSA